MRLQDAEHDFKNSLFKVIGYVKYELKCFLVLKFFYWSVGRWSVHLVRSWLIGGQ